MERLRLQVMEFLVLGRPRCCDSSLFTCGVCRGGRGGFGVVVTPTHSHPGAVESCAGDIPRHNLLRHATIAPPPCKHPEGGWVGGAGGYSPCGREATQTAQYTARHVPRQRRAAPCTAGPATRRGAQLRTARLEGLKFRGVQMQTRGNFLAEQRKLWKVVESFLLQPAEGVGDES